MTLSKPNEPIVVKKYANRRLYNTATSSYVTLEQLREVVAAGGDIRVVDAKSGVDLTRSIMTQIVLEQESSGPRLLPDGFLRALIAYYDDEHEPGLRAVLDEAMQTFRREHPPTPRRAAASEAGAGRKRIDGARTKISPAEFEALQAQLAEMQAQLMALMKNVKD